MSRVGPERRCLSAHSMVVSTLLHLPPGHLASRFLRVDIHASIHEHHVQSSSLAYGIHSRNLPPCLCRKRDEERGGHAFGLMLERDAVWHRVGTRVRAGRDSITLCVHKGKSRPGQAAKRRGFFFLLPELKVVSDLKRGSTRRERPL